MRQGGVEPGVGVGGAEGVVGAPVRGTTLWEAGRFPANHCFFALPLALVRLPQVGGGR